MPYKFKRDCPVCGKPELLWLATYRAISLEFIRHFYRISYFPVYIASLIKFDVITSSNPILVNRDVILGRCRVDVGSMWGWCEVDQRSRRGRCGEAEYCNADCTTWKLTLQDINTTSKELKTERDCNHRRLFRPFWGSSPWRNNQRKTLMKNIRALWF